jgi:hypothetical protein
MGGCWRQKNIIVNINNIYTIIIYLLILFIVYKYNYLLSKEYIYTISIYKKYRIENFNLLSL